MQFYHLAILSLNLFISTSTATQLPVCVIGAGPSGIIMARKLKVNNINYRLFEAESRVGGKAYTWRDSINNPVEMGAFFFLKRDDGINRAVKDAGLELKWFNGSSVDVYNQSGISKKLPIDTNEDKAQFVDAVNRYSALREKYNLTVGYVNAPPETQVSLDQWLKSNNLNVLRSFFIPNVVIQGYGALEDIPAMYIIKAFDIRGLTSLQQFGYALWTVSDGLDKLWGNLSLDLNLSLNHKVSVVDRTSNKCDKKNIRLHFENKAIKPVTCSHVVMAFPPYLSKLNYMVTDLDNNEKELISKININHYGSTAIESSGSEWESGFIFNLISEDGKYPNEPVGRGETIGFVKQGKYYTGYSFVRGDYSRPASQSVLNHFKSKQIHLLKKMDQYQNSSSKIVFQKSFPYFPHVAFKDIQQGFFKKFDALQGFKNTFYITSAIAFETMNESIEMSEFIFFNKLLPKVKA